MSRKLVSVVTGTWQRHDLLLEAIENVRRQTYPNIEHVIVSDGLDNSLPPYAINLRDGLPAISQRHYSLGFNTSSLFENSYAAGPMLVGQLLARGEYLTWLADDERMQPDHVEALVGALEAEGADFAYSQTEMYYLGRPEHRWTIGTDPPQCGQITNVLYRRQLLARGITRFGADPTPDWDQIKAWIDNGAIWAYVPRVTFEHRADR
jgi:GT2 family glycosyltransferase